MNAVPARLAAAYWGALQRYLVRLDEAQRSRAYELGRHWLAEGLGVLEVAAAHRDALQRLYEEQRAHRDFDATLAAAFDFLAECLAPFEMSHRGARDGARAMRRLNETLESEAKRIAHLLHDEAGQLVATVQIALAGLVEELSPKGQRKLDEVKALLRRIDDELRNVSHELRPMVLDRLGLIPALKLLAQNVARRSGIRVTVIGNDESRLPAVMEIALYRIAQEALANVLRHSRACRARIDVRVTNGRVQCEVSDDGVGFAREMLERGDGLGIIGMRERLNALGGMLYMESKPETGTTLRAEIPWRTQDALHRAARG